jgi:hypothetical protein
MTSPNFVLAVGPASGSAPSAEITDFTDWSLEDNLDDGGSLQFSCRGNSQGALAIDELATDVWLYQDGSAIYRMRIVGVEQTWGPDGEDDITVSAADYRRILKARNTVLPLLYNGLSQGDIVWDLIDHTQSQTNGNLGITLADNGPTVLRDRIYYIGTNIFDAIQEFTQIDNGLAWKIDASLALSIYSQQGFPTATQPIGIGINAIRMTRPSSAEQFANVAIVVGNNQALQPYIATAPGLGADPRGRWERVQSFPGESDPTAQQELADGLVQETISPAATWTIEMEPSRYFYDSEYQTGDLVTIIQPRSTVYAVGSPSPTISGQILSRSMSQDADGNMTIVVTAVELP